MFKPLNSVNTASEQLAETFKRLVPLQPVHAVSSNAAPAKDTGGGGLTSFYEAARAERVRLKLGVIGLARVAFGVQQRLLAAGYPPPLVKQVLFAMLTSALVKKQS